MQPCAEQLLLLSLALNLGSNFSLAGSPPAALWDAFAAMLVQDAASALDVSPLRIRVTGVSPLPQTTAVPWGVNGSALSLVSVSVLPPSTSFGAVSGGSAANGAAELPGSDLATVLSSLKVCSVDASAPPV